MHPDMSMKVALLMYFEQQVKEQMERVMEALEMGGRSTVEFFKKVCMSIAADLLICCPEQEVRLLSMVVSKLGDASSSVCSKSIELLKLILFKHSAMKAVVVREIRQFIYKPNNKLKSIFNGIIFLSQVTLAKGEHAVATQLIECYMSLFEKAIKEGELGSRLLSALLTGINKSFPFLTNTDSLGRYVDSLFRIVHTAPSFSTSTQALTLLSYLALDSKTELKSKPTKDNEIDLTGEKDIGKRYYRALYAKLLSDDVTTYFSILIFFIIIILLGY
jgi:ribosome biogenesis protein MAK21